mgnify:CR=1 FL=1
MLIRNMRRKNPKPGLIGLRYRLWARGYARYLYNERAEFHVGQNRLHILLTDVLLMDEPLSGRNAVKDIVPGEYI